MQAHGIMSRPVYCLTADASVEEAASLMVKCGFTTLPVVAGDGSLLGVVTEEDLARARFAPSETTPGGDAARLAPRDVRELVREPAPVVSEDTELRDIVTVMVESGCRCLPVVSDGHHPVGMISWRDVLAQLLPGPDRDHAGPGM